MPTLAAWQRTAAVVGAIIAFGAAVILVQRAGLPDRAAFSGEQVAGMGYVAPEVGEQAPPFTRQTLTGGELSLMNLRGKSVIVNFWATWCVPCIREMPQLQALYESTDVQLLAVNMGEDRDTVARWVDELGLTFTILLDPTASLVDAYRLRGQPSTYVIAPDGIITHIYYGETTADALRSALETHTTSTE